MSLSELRAELKAMRKKVSPAPISRMKKADCVRELEALKRLHHKEEAMEKKIHEREEEQVEAIAKKAGIPKKTAKKVAVMEAESHGMEEAMTKKEHKKQTGEGLPRGKAVMKKEKKSPK